MVQWRWLNIYITHHASVSNQRRKSKYFAWHNKMEPVSLGSKGPFVLITFRCVSHIRPRAVITSPSVEMLFAKTSPAACVSSAAQVQLPGHFSVILWQLRPVDSSSFFFFLSPGSILQAQLAFIFVEGTKWICHHSSRRQRRQRLVNAIIYKILKSQVVSENPHTLNLQILTSGESHLFHIHIASGALPLGDFVIM